jgi:Tfp pilus assembly protein PilV
MNSYASVQQIIGTAVLDIEGSAHDARLLQLAENVSRQVDRQVGRSFYSSQNTRYYNGNGSTALIVADLVSIDASGLKESDNLDGTYDLVWATADYWEWPYQSDPKSNYDAKPKLRLLVNAHSNSTKSVFEAGQRNYEVTGTFGYSAVTATIGNASSSFSSAATSIKFATGTVEAGWTLLHGTEQMYVRSVDASGTTGTVTRAVNGASAAVIASNASFSRYEYPGPISEAVLIQAGRLYKRAAGGFVQELGLPGGGEVIPIIPVGLDRDVRQMIGPYRRRSI